MRYICHVGVHKTGTSLLQENLRRNINALREQGVYYVNVEDRETIRAQMWMIRRLERRQALPGMRALKDANARLRERAEAAGARAILLSHEDRIGYAPYKAFPLQQQTASFYPYAGGCLRRIFHGFAPNDQRILLYSRKQTSLFPSLFSEGLRNLACPFDIATFFDRIDKESFQFRGLIERIRAVLPHTNLRMRRFETIRDGAENFVSQFLRDADMDPASFTITTATVRPSFDQAQADALIALTKAVNAGDLSPAERKQQFAQIVERAPDPANPIIVPKEVRDRCEALAQKDLFEFGF